jgi:hypothetical protein
MVEGVVFFKLHQLRVGRKYIGAGEGTTDNADCDD